MLPQMFCASMRATCFYPCKPGIFEATYEPA
jgi:hypothetical protein